MLALGYGYVGLMVVPVVGLVAVLIYLATLKGTALVVAIKLLKAGWPLILVLPIVLRALFVRVPKPDGEYLSGAEKRAVLEFLEPIRKASNGPKVHEVLVTEEMNAAVVQIPRFGFVGPTRNYLILGLPLMTLMSADEVRAVVAHEFGHMSKTHGRLGVYSYRLNQTLQRVLTSVQERTKVRWESWGFKFFHWFQPKFDELSFALRRAQEYEADRLAAAVAGPQAMIDALCRLSYTEPRYQSYWNKLWSQSDHEASNRGLSPWAALWSGTAGQADGSRSQAALAEALTEPTSETDTHPSLADRIQALGKPVPEALEEVNEPATTAVFGELGPSVFTRFDEQWRENTAGYWAESYADSQKRRERLKTLQAAGDLNMEEQLELAGLLESIEGIAAAAPVYRAYISENPDDADAWFHFGRASFEADYLDAEAAFLKAMALDITWLPHARRFIDHHYETVGEPEQATEVLGELLGQYETLSNAADAERGSVEVTDKFLTHSYSDDVLAQIIRFFDAKPELRGVWLLRKAVEHFPEDPVHLFVLDVNYFHSNVNIDEDKYIGHLVDDLSAAVVDSGVFFVALRNKHNQWGDVADTVEPLVQHKQVSWLMRFLRGLGKLVLYYLALFLIVFVLAYINGWVA